MTALAQPGDGVANEEILVEAARRAGTNSDGASIVRDGSNVIYRLPNNVIARIGQPGTNDVAVREVKLAHWLARCGIPVVQALSDVPQDIVIDDRPVTWWAELPEHRSATPAELGSVLRTFHALPEPEEIELPDHDPFASLNQAGPTPVLTGDEWKWLDQRLNELRQQYLDIGPRRVIHGDAWQGNVAVTNDGQATLLDLEKVSRGRRDWDLIHLAVDYTDFGRITQDGYYSFVAAYGGFDVTNIDDYRTLADIQELRWTFFALRKASTSSTAAREARHRLACLRGEHPRPWTWQAL